jgi:hypothetical protein
MFDMGPVYEKDSMDTIEMLTGYKLFYEDEIRQELCLTDASKDVGMWNMS